MVFPNSLFPTSWREISESKWLVSLYTELKIYRKIVTGSHSQKILFILSPTAEILPMSTPRQDMFWYWMWTFFCRESQLKSYQGTRAIVVSFLEPWVRTMFNLPVALTPLLPPWYLSWWQYIWGWALLRVGGYRGKSVWGWYNLRLHLFEVKGIKALTLKAGGYF